MFTASEANVKQSFINTQQIGFSESPHLWGQGQVWVQLRASLTPTFS